MSARIKFGFVFVLRRRWISGWWVLRERLFIEIFATSMTTAEEFCMLLLTHGDAIGFTVPVQLYRMRMLSWYLNIFCLTHSVSKRWFERILELIYKRVSLDWAWRSRFPVVNKVILWLKERGWIKDESEEYVQLVRWLWCEVPGRDSSRFEACKMIDFTSVITAILRVSEMCCSDPIPHPCSYPKASDPNITARNQSPIGLTKTNHSWLASLTAKTCILSIATSFQNH